MMEKAEQCSGCGLTERDWLEDPDAYVPLQVVCPWCASKDRARSDGDTDSSIPGASIKLVTQAAAERVVEVKPSRPMSRRERKNRQ